MCDVLARAKLSLLRYLNVVMRVRYQLCILDVCLEQDIYVPPLMSWCALLSPLPWDLDTGETPEPRQTVFDTCDSVGEHTR